MALMPQDTPITRDNVLQWYTGWKKSRKSKTWEEYLRQKVDDLDIEDREINTTELEGFGDTTHVVDMILADMKSYDPDYGT